MYLVLFYADEYVEFVGRFFEENLLDREARKSTSSSGATGLLLLGHLLLPLELREKKPGLHFQLVCCLLRHKIPTEVSIVAG